MKKILYVVDAQNDYMKDGSIPVDGSNDIIPVINELIRQAESYNNMFFIRDLHPVNHASFASSCEVEPFEVTPEGIKLPDHCVGGTEGGKIHCDITVPAELGERLNILDRGTHALIDEPSGYSIKLQSEPGIGPFLQQWVKASEVDLVGISTNGSLKYTALDLRKHSAKVNVLLSACRGLTDEEIVELKVNKINVED